MIPENERLAALLGQAVLEAVDRAVARRLPELLAQAPGTPARDGYIGSVEAARRWGVKPDTVLAAIASGRLPASKPSGSKAWRIRPADLEAFLAGEGKGLDPHNPPVDLDQHRAERAARARGRRPEGEDLMSAGRRLPWVKVATDLLDHPKTTALEHRLADERASFYLIAVWFHVGRFYIDGIIPDTEDNVRGLERAARWRGPPGDLRKHLVEVGFLDAKDGRLEIHGWMEWSGAYQVKLDRDKAYQQHKRAKRERNSCSVVGATSCDVESEREKENQKENQSSPPPDERWAALRARLSADEWHAVVEERNRRFAKIEAERLWPADQRFKVEEMEEALLREVVSEVSGSAV